MSAAIKAATVASGLGLFSAAGLYSLRTPKQDFSAQAQALDHTAEAPSSAPLPKPKLYVCRLSRITCAIC